MPAWTEKKESDLMISIMMTLGKGKKPQCSWGAILELMEQRGHNDLTVNACSLYFGRLWDKWVKKSGGTVITTTTSGKNNKDSPKSVKAESKPQTPRKPRAKATPRKTPKKATKAETPPPKTAADAYGNNNDDGDDDDDEADTKKTLLMMKQLTDEEDQNEVTDGPVRVKPEPQDASASHDILQTKMSPRDADRRKRRRSDFAATNNTYDGSA